MQREVCSFLLCSIHQFFHLSLEISIPSDSSAYFSFNLSFQIWQILHGIISKIQRLRIWRSTLSNPFLFFKTSQTTSSTVKNTLCCYTLLYQRFPIYTDFDGNSIWPFSTFSREGCGRTNNLEIMKFPSWNILPESQHDNNAPKHLHTCYEPGTRILSFNSTQQNPYRV